MAAHPDMILQLAHHISREERRAGRPGVEVRADALASLNGREPQPLVYPDVDLAVQPRSLAPAAWIVPLYEPLPARHAPPPDADE
jgi:hypothetical protein